MTGTTGLTEMNMPMRMQTQNSAHRKITLIARVVGEGCNLKCGYCWFRNCNQTFLKIMSDDVVEKLIKDASSFDQPSYSFVWLGGEPLLAGIDFFKRILDYQKFYLGNKIVRNKIQTNGLLLDDEWIHFFLNSSFKIGISIDGPKDIHDHYRVDAENKGSFDRVFRNIQRCHQMGLKFGAIATITDLSVNQPDRIFDFFVSSEIKGFGLNFAHEVEGENTLPFSVSSNQYAEFMIRIFDKWLEADDPGLRIREIDNLLIGLSGGRPRTCMSNGSCGNFFSVDVNGDILPCERLSVEIQFGNLMQTDLKSCLTSQKYDQHLRTTSNLPSACISCRWFNACHGGCTHYRTSGKPIFCDGNKRIFQHILNRLQ